jgi:hypothetical protein
MACIIYIKTSGRGIGGIKVKRKFCVDMCRMFV